MMKKRIQDVRLAPVHVPLKKNHVEERNGIFAKTV